MEVPKMTVILFFDKQRERGNRCLQSVLAQTVIDQIEVLLLDASSETEAPLAGSTHSSIRLLQMPLRKTYGDVIVHAIEHARAPIVAMIEEHCIAFPGWAEALIQAHQGQYAVVSGEIMNANGGQGASDLIHSNNYAATMPPRTRGETTHLIGHNSSFKRDVLLKYRSELIDLFQVDLLLSWRLQQDGYKLFAEPDAKIAHANETYARSHRTGIYLANQAFGAARVRTNRWSILRRAFYVSIAPLAPWIRLARQIVLMRKEQPQLLSSFRLGDLGTLWTFHASAVMGQAVGLIWGVGDASERFLYFEMNEYRFIEGVNVLKIFTRIRG